MIFNSGRSCSRCSTSWCWSTSCTGCSTARCARRSTVAARRTPRPRPRRSRLVRRPTALQQTTGRSSWRTSSSERQEMIRKAREQAEAERQAIDGRGRARHAAPPEEVAQQLERERDEALQSLRAELRAIGGRHLPSVFCTRRPTRRSSGNLPGGSSRSCGRFPDDERQRLRGELEARRRRRGGDGRGLERRSCESSAAAIEALAGRTVSLSVQSRPDAARRRAAAARRPCLGRLAGRARSTSSSRRRGRRRGGGPAP